MATTIKSENKTFAAERAPVAEEIDEEQNCDPNKLLTCPFDKNHQIRVCRFPYHLIKCRKNHPKLARQLQTCPFNARHLVPKDELKHHTRNCKDRMSMETEHSGSVNGFCSWQVPVSTWVNQNMTEDWDEEADDNAPPFVWNNNSGGLEYPHMGRSTNNLVRSYRPPSTFPWLGYNQ